MKVKDIQVDGFGVWTGLSVDSLPESMTLFYGPNEAGKTTLMQFLRAMLYGFTEDRRQRYLPPVHGGTPGGAIRVTGPGGGYEIRRHHQLSDDGIQGQLSVTGQDGLSQGQHRLSMLLGQIDEPIFTNVFAIGIRELQELSTLDDTAAADELYKLSSGLDRVSLVDVMRSLRGGRRELIGRSRPEESAEASKLAGLIDRREKLRDEVDRLTRSGRRWSELANQRRTQRQEIEHLTERMTAWEKEARCVEIAMGVHETWTERECVAAKIAETQSHTQLPEEAPGQLVQIEAALQDRQTKLEEVKQKRRDIRDKAEQLPVSKKLLELQGRIEAASEQATWIEALEEQIERLDDQIEKTRSQLDADAQRLGLDDDDREALLRGDTGSLPDLSKQTLAALAGPAREVKEQLFFLKQARNEGREYKTKADKLGEQLHDVLGRAHASNLQEAIREETETIAQLRHRMHLGQHLEKLKRHYRDLEKESVELTTAEALPVDRMLLLGVPFFVGGVAFLYGFFNLLEITWFVANPDPTWGMLSIMFGFMSMLAFYFGRENGRRATSFDLEDCERQIDTLRRQIREVEAERDHVDSTLPTSSESLELRIRESEQLLAELEASLPTYHSHQAATQSYKAARDRASKAASGLKEARRDWTETLQRLGLSETLSPSSVRKLSEGYSALQATLRRMDELKNEKSQRRRERKSIAERIESLYLEARHADDERNAEPNRDDDSTADSRPASRATPLEQLNHLNEELSRQQHWIRRRRELKEQDHQLKKQQAGHHRAIERAEQQRRSLWAKCGVATAEQFYEMVDTKTRLSELRQQHSELDKQVRSIIGNHVEYDDVASELAGAKASDLERRWDSLTSRMSETENRVAHLRTQQGELSQEMKQLGEDDRLSTAQLELGCTERQIAAVARRWQTLAMASCLLEDVCNTFERERQPETLREASAFLTQLTDGKYTRIWTPLGTNRLMIDAEDDNSLSLEILSRGTREAVFMALRLSLAAAYARRGVMLPLVLDDVLVNFDGHRAVHAAKTLKTFAEMGHQVMMFTCHQHIVDIFHEIGIEVRQMPAQGEPGRAGVLAPPAAVDETIEPAEEEPVETETEPVAELDEDVAEEPAADDEQAEIEPAEPEAVESPEPVQTIRYVHKKLLPPAPKPAPAVHRPRPVPPPEREPVAPEPAPAIQWAWFEREPADGRLDDDEIAAEAARSDWLEDDNTATIGAIPRDDRNQEGSWWNGGRTTASSQSRSTSA